MSSKKRKIVLIVSIISVLSVLFVTIAATALSKGGISDLWNNAANKDGVVKYEKPSVGDIAQDGAYPDEVKSNVSPNAQEKEWYEYIVYSKKSIGEHILDKNTKAVFYDPYDYTYGMVMEIKDTIQGPSYEIDGDLDLNSIDEKLMFWQKNDLDPGKEIASTWSTANFQTISFSFSESCSVTNSASLDFTIGEEIKFAAGALFANAESNTKFELTTGGSSSISKDYSAAAAITQEFNAVHFDSNGTPYPWRVVSYVVKIPLYCEIQTLCNGEWIVQDTLYCLLSTVQGTCRQWYNNGAFIEDWKTGAAITVDDFWKGFFTKKGLEAAYQEKLLPQS
jgi:hypothetical protein